MPVRRKILSFLLETLLRNVKKLPSILQLDFSHTRTILYVCLSLLFLQLHQPKVNTFLDIFSEHSIPTLIIRSKLFIQNQILSRSLEIVSDFGVIILNTCKSFIKKLISVLNTPLRYLLHLRYNFVQRLAIHRPMSLSISSLTRVATYDNSLR